MKKFKFLVKYGLKKRIGRKAFLISNIVVAVLMIIIINIPSIVSLFGGNEQEDQQIYINMINETSEVDLIADFSVLLNEPYNGNIYYVLTPQNINDFDEDEFWKNDNSNITIDISGTIENPIVTLYSKKPEHNYYLASQLELQLINYQITNYQRPI
ncbi:MAG: hypothetical protein JXC31_03945, partial [Acholeplasmataceae bacterium]|nr:hypothetical protein [Acholeplasmataceae bacterium]